MLQHYNAPQSSVAGLNLCGFAMTNALISVFQFLSKVFSPLIYV